MNKKNVIITGTSRGIGYQLVKMFSTQGHNVLALSRNSEPILKLKLGNVEALDFNLCIDDHFGQVTKYIDKEWGRVDILINNAGYLLNKPFAETTLQDLKDVYSTNVFGLAEMIRTSLPFMRQNGHVVNISSMGGVQGSVKFAGLSAYSSSKAAVIGLTELLAEEYKDSGPSFNVLALGAVQTEMLSEAFPGYAAPISAMEMAEYIFNFAINGNKFHNGKILQVANSTP